MTSCATKSGIFPQKEIYNCKISAESFITPINIDIRSSKFQFWKKEHAIRLSKKKKLFLIQDFRQYSGWGTDFFLNTVYVGCVSKPPCVTINRELYSRESYRCSSRSMHSSCPVIMEGQSAAVL